MNAEEFRMSPGDRSFILRYVCSILWLFGPMHISHAVFSGGPLAAIDVDVA